MSIRHFTIEDPTDWYQRRGRKIFLGAVLDASTSDTMSVGFGRYTAGESNEWTVTYDEALIVTRGVFTVRSAEQAVTASAGEVVFLTAGTSVTYQADDDCDLVYVTYPHWMDAQRSSAHADQLDNFLPVPPPAPS